MLVLELVQALAQVFVLDLNILSMDHLRQIVNAQYNMGQVDHLPMEVIVVFVFVIVVEFVQ